jgi:hypothetical protein
MSTITTAEANLGYTEMNLLEKSSPMKGLMKLWYLKVMGDKLNVPTPRDEPKYRSHVPAWRVLLVGNGPTHGWGVGTHGLAMTGQLALSLRQRIDTPVDLDYVGDEMMNAATTVKWLEGTDVSAYDLIVVVLSMNDAVRLADPDVWHRQVQGTLAYLRDRKRPATKLHVVGMQPVASVDGYDNLFGKIGQRHADRLNAIMRESVLLYGDTFMTLSEPVNEAGRPYGSPITYRNWSDEIADATARLLPTGSPETAVLEDKQEWNWSGAPKALGHDGVDRSAPLREIVDEARKRFKAPIAYISVVDGGKQMFPTASGPMAASVPLELSYCNEAVKQDDTLIIPNGKKDERFKDNPYIDLTSMKFYAGKALKDEAGEVIGTFCIMAPFARSEKSLNVAEFESYAERAQTELRRIEKE